MKLYAIPIFAAVSGIAHLFADSPLNSEGVITVNTLVNAAGAILLATVAYLVQAGVRSVTDSLSELKKTHKGHDKRLRTVEFNVGMLTTKAGIKPARSQPDDDEDDEG